MVDGIPIERSTGDDPSLAIPKFCARPSIRGLGEVRYMRDAQRHPEASYALPSSRLRWSALRSCTSAASSWSFAARRCRSSLESCAAARSRSLSPRLRARSARARSSSIRPASLRAAGSTPGSSLAGGQRRHRRRPRRSPVRRRPQSHATTDHCCHGHPNGRFGGRGLASIRSACWWTAPR